MSAKTSGSTAIGRALGHHEDGLLDIFLGLVLLDAWTIIRGQPGAASGGAFVILFPLLLVAKGAITVPRLPSAGTASPGPGPASKAFGRVVVLSVASAVVLLLLAIKTPSALPGGVLDLDAWELLALAGLGTVAAAGLRLGAPRFAAYATLALAAFVLRSHSSAAYFAPALASGIVGWGGVLLVRFLTASPRVA